MVDFIILISKNDEKVIKNQNLFLFLFAFSNKKKEKENRQNKATAYKAQWTRLLGLPNPTIVQNGHAPWTNHENHYIMGMDVYCARFSAHFKILAYHTVFAQIPQKHLTTDNGPGRPKKTCPLCGFVPCTGNPKKAT
jgi:CDP-glycerol glycerophosphotransferase (TagB/SpsB family)